MKPSEEIFKIYLRKLKEFTESVPSEKSLPSDRNQWNHESIIEYLDNQYIN